MTRKEERERKWSVVRAGFYAFCFLSTVINHLLSDSQAVQRQDKRRRQAARKEGRGLSNSKALKGPKEKVVRRTRLSWSLRLHGKEAANTPQYKHAGCIILSSASLSVNDSFVIPFPSFKP